MPRYFLIAILDIVGSGQRSNPDQEWLHQRMYEIVQRALAKARIEAPHSEDRGDGVLLLLPGSTPKPAVLGPFVDALETELRGHARLHRQGPRTLRLRLALHAGEVAWGGQGWVGADLNTAFRMVELPAVRRPLDVAPKAVLSLAVSDALHHAVIRHDYPGIDPVEYRAVRFSAKELQNETVWIRVPGYVEPPGLSAEKEPAASTRPAASTGPGPSPGPSGDRTPPPPGNSGIGTVFGGISRGGIGVSHGEVKQTWSREPGDSAQAGDLKRELEQLRAELDEARRRQEVTERTYQDAAAEINEAERHTETNDETERGPLLRALHRLRGLVEDVSGLAAMVGALIHAVQGQV